MNAPPHSYLSELLDSLPYIILGWFWHVSLIKHRFPLSPSGTQNSESPAVLVTIANSQIFLLSRHEMGPRDLPQAPQWFKGDDAQSNETRISTLKRRLHVDAMLTSKSKVSQQQHSIHSFPIRTKNQGKEKKLNAPLIICFSVWNDGFSNTSLGGFHSPILNTCYILLSSSITAGFSFSHLLPFTALKCLQVVSIIFLQRSTNK